MKLMKPLHIKKPCRRKNGSSSCTRDIWVVEEIKTWEKIVNISTKRTK
jgi:hypothetical protein